MQFFGGNRCMNFTKKNIMRFYTKKQKEEVQTETNNYDSFVNYLDSVYFSGASEVLETELIAFEYENYVHSHS